jgi:hypothetical protein
MIWIPKDKEIETVLASDGRKRYRYCVEKVVIQQQVWSLRQGGGWVLAGDDDGHELVPIWPHEKFALRSATGIWAGCLPEAIELDAWLEHWIPGLEKDGRLIAVFPSPADKGVAVAPKRFETDLRKVLAQCE